MTKREILFDSIEEQDVDNEGNPVKEIFEESSPFHDDHNDDSEDGKLLFELDPEDSLEDVSASVVYDPSNIPNRKSGADPSVMARRFALHSGHQTAYKECPQIDFVDEEREKEKLRLMEKMRKLNEEYEAKGYAWPDAWKDRPQKKVAMNRMESAQGVGKPVPFFLKVLAQRIGVEATELRWPRYMNDLTNKQITQVVNKVSTKKRRAAVWNMVVPQLSPEEQFRRSHPMTELPHILHEGKPVKVRATGGSSIRRIPASLPEWEGAYIGNPTTAPNGIVDYSTVKDPMEFGLLMSEQWMEDVESGKAVTRLNRKTGEQEPVITQCKVTGVSLVHKKTSGYKEWRLAPNLWGMSIKTTKVVVTAAALESGLILDADGNPVPGKVNYPAKTEEDLRAAVADLRNNPDVFCILAVVTANKRLREVAEVMLYLRDTVYFKLDDDTVDRNRRELKQLGKRLAAFR